MRKQTKIAAIVSAAALLAIGASMASFAATGWQDEDGVWRYYDRDGYAVTEAWRSSGGQWFWLDENGEMATNKLLENADDNGNTYYVGPTGARVTNQWVAITDEEAGYYGYDEDNDAGYNWYYFQASGKAYKTTGATSFKLINGKYYAFDGDGRMLYGWVSEQSERIVGDDAYKQGGMYYCGDISDGARVTNDWRKLYVGNYGPNTNDSQDDTYWFYFGANGKKINGAGEAKGYKTKSINGKTYAFDQDGIMQTTWIDGQTTVDTTPFAFYGDEADGARRKGWYKKVPSEDVDKTAYDNGDLKWFYANNNGTLVHDQVKTISSKKYAFNSKGEMLSGLWALAIRPSDNYILGSEEINTESEANDLRAVVRTVTEAAGRSAYIYYFGGSDDGAMKVNNQHVTVDGVDFQFTFGKSGATYGQGLNGLQNRVFYVEGKRTQADSDYRYQAIHVTVEEDGKSFGTKAVTVPVGYTYTSPEEDEEGGEYYYLVNTAGTQMTGTKYIDAEGRVYELESGSHRIKAVYWRN